MRTNSPARACLFDFDGTLGRSLPHWADAYNEALVQRGITLERSDVIAACFSSSGKEVMSRYPIQDPEEFREEIWQGVLNRIHVIDPYPEVVDVIATLKAQGILVALVTNSRRGHVLPVLERWGVRDAFDSCIAIEDVSHGKPEPEAIHKALSRLGVSPADAVMVGDSPADLIAGARAHVKTVAFSPEENRAVFPEDLLRSHTPSYVVSSYAEFRHLVLPRLVPTDFTPSKTETA